MFRLRHTSVSGFLLCGSLAVCHALRPTPPSSNRTCGFPASGFPGSSRLWHSFEVFQPLLGLSAQPCSQKDAFVFRNGAFAQAVHLSSQATHASSKAPSLHGHYPASSLLWASPTPGQARLAVMSSLKLVQLPLLPCRVSQVPRLIFLRTPSPLTPESPLTALPRFFVSGSRLHHIRQIGHSQLRVTRPKRVRFRYGLRFCLPRLRTIGLLQSALSRLHVHTRNLHGELLSVH